MWLYIAYGNLYTEWVDILLRIDILIHLATPCKPAAISWQLAALLCAVLFIYLRKSTLGIRYCKPTIVPDYQEPVINCKQHSIILLEHLYQVWFWYRSKTEHKVWCAIRRNWREPKQSCFVATWVDCYTWFLV